MVAILETFMRNRFKVSEERLTICRTCDQYEPVTSQCKQCGCFMNFKTLMPISSCPLGKWTEWKEKKDLTSDTE